jgi:hypothetical protein
MSKVIEFIYKVLEKHNSNGEVYYAVAFTIMFFVLIGLISLLF